MIDAQTTRIEELETELAELKPFTDGKSVISNETRIICPMCQAVGKNIRETEDRDKILYYSGSIPMYAKKYVCKSCGYNWK
jgi:C4-type Zn-finger protein